MAEDNPVPPPEGNLMQVVKPDFLGWIFFAGGFSGGLFWRAFLVVFLGRIDFLRIFLMGFPGGFPWRVDFFADFSPHVQEVS